MKLKVIIPAIFTVMLTSCFMGADTYEKSVNDYFFLYSNTYKTDKVSLGTIQYGQYRIADGYLVVIEEIGWDKSFMIIKLRDRGFYIQDLRPLKDIPAEDFAKYLYGPFTKEQFHKKRDSLGVNEDLDFSISY